MLSDLIERFFFPFLFAILEVVVVVEFELLPPALSPFSIVVLFASLLSF